MRLDADIHFLIPVPDRQPDRTTPLQGFSLSLCENARLIRAACFLPSNIYDFTPEGIETFLARRIGGIDPVHWYPQSPRAIMSVPLPAFVPFTVLLLGDEQSPDEYARWVKASEVPPTIVAEKGGDLSFAQFDLDGLRDRFLAICDLIPGTVLAEDVQAAKEAIRSWLPLPARKLGYQVGGHASVTPNLMALTAAGFTDMVYGPFENIGQGNQPYIEQIVKTARSIFELRGEVGLREPHRTFRPPPDLNLFAPAISPLFFSRPIPDSLSGHEKRQFRTARTALQRQSGYQFEARTDAQLRAIFGVDSAALSSGAAKPQPHILFRTRQRELALATECVGALVASEISPTLRLPNDINRTAGEVRQFASHYRSDRPSSKKRLLTFRNIQARLAKAVPAEFYEFIHRSKQGIRIISDAHLEWLDIDGLPLAIRKNVSHIPVTPGNLFVEQLMAQSPLYLTPETFREVLVISALKRDDPIKGFFEIAFEIFGKQWKDLLDVRFIEVASEEQLIAALNDFPGALVIFDGHGSHEPDAPGYLHLMDTPIDVWDLRGTLKRPPPIVVLSACDTHAADRNHATAANGFLALGTRAVLGTVFPLGAYDAASFAARLLFRVSSFVPVAVRMFGHALTWTEVVSGMLRMQLLTCFLRNLETKKIITHDTYIDVHQKGNIAINSGHDDPFAAVCELLQFHGVGEALIKAELESAVANSSVISYLNLGRPETILLDTKERLDSQLEEVFV